jgi:predicted nucleic acid-binding protein
MKWYFDSNVLVAAGISEHTHHVPAAATIQEMLRHKHRGCLSAHGLTEVYSVLTRTPFTPRISPAMARQIIESQILPHMTLVSLDPDEYIEIVRRAATEGWIGGRIHDAIHLQCAAKMKCDRVYTFNIRDFRALAPTSLAEKITAP